MARSSAPEKVREWRRRMARFEKSGLSVVRFCEAEGVSAPCFYQWRKRLRREAEPEQPPPSFQAVRVVGSPVVAVRLPGGTQLELPTGDPEVLQRAIDAVARADREPAAGDETC